MAITAIFNGSFCAGMRCLQGSRRTTSSVSLLGPCFSLVGVVFLLHVAQQAAFRNVRSQRDLSYRVKLELRVSRGMMSKFARH